MEEVLINTLNSCNLSAMKNPIILMNCKGLECFIKQLEAQVIHLKLGYPTMYHGIPVRCKVAVPRGEFLICDDAEI